MGFVLQLCNINNVLSSSLEVFIVTKLIVNLFIFISSENTSQARKNKLTVFLQLEHVTEPQSGQIKRRCFGLAKKPDEH